MEVLDLSSLLKITVEDFADTTECVDFREAVSEADVGRSWGRDLNASRRGMMMRTCWQTTRDGRNLHGLVSNFEPQEMFFSGTESTPAAAVSKSYLPSSWGKIVVYSCDPFEIRKSKCDPQGCTR
jgi:hypothetical protein